MTLRNRFAAKYACARMTVAPNSTRARAINKGEKWPAGRIG